MKSRQTRDEKDVTSIMSTIDNMVNPFDNNFEKLVHIVSGLEASNEVEEATKTMWETGEAEFTSYVFENILSETPDIYKTMKKTNLKTFQNQSKKVTTKNSKNEMVAVKSTKDLFAKIVLLAQSRDVDMREVLKYSLRPYPSPLASYDGSMVKTQKSKLLQILETTSGIDSVDDIPHESCIVIDAMALLQTIKDVPSTFEELSLNILQNIIAIASKFGSKRIDLVCDRYPDHSIKGSERAKRGSSGSTAIKVFGRSQKVPRQWKKFLTSGNNKEEIMEFLFTDWKQLHPTSFQNKEIFLSHKGQCHRFFVKNQSINNESVAQLECDHEEADTRMALHVKHADECGFTNIIVRSPDTDVFLIMLFISSSLTSNLFFLTGTGMKRRIIPVTIHGKKLGTELCSALIGFHSFTGK